MKRVKSKPAPNPPSADATPLGLMAGTEPQYQKLDAGGGKREEKERKGKESNVTKCCNNFSHTRHKKELTLDKIQAMSRRGGIRRGGSRPDQLQRIAGGVTHDEADDARRRRQLR